MLRVTAFVVLLLAAACAPTSEQRQAAEAAPEAAAAAAAPARASEPAELAARIDALGRAFDGRVGIAVRDIQAGWTTGLNIDEPFPQQSVSKLWVAVTTLDALDRGELSLSDQVLVRREDLSVFHQPIRRHVDDDGYRTTVGELLRGAIAQSDNAANDLLIRRVGGVEAVRQMIERKQLGRIKLGAEERVLQSRIAGLEWRPEYSFGRAFWEARDQVPDAQRRAAMDAYLADPFDAATPAAMVAALGRLSQGELLSPASTQRLLTIMSETETGPRRLRAGAAEGWTLAHKTGTGQVLDGMQTGYNDVGLLTAPNGRTYAVAVLIAHTRRPVPERQELMANVARAVVEHHCSAYPQTCQAGAAPLEGAEQAG